MTRHERYNLLAGALWFVVAMSGLVALSYAWGGWDALKPRAMLVRELHDAEACADRWRALAAPTLAGDLDARDRLLAEMPSECERRP